MFRGSPSTPVYPPYPTSWIRNLQILFQNENKYVFYFKFCFKMKTKKQTRQISVANPLPLHICISNLQTAHLICSHRGFNRLGFQTIIIKRNNMSYQIIFYYGLKPEAIKAAVRADKVRGLQNTNVGTYTYNRACFYNHLRSHAELTPGRVKSLAH